MLQKSSNTVRKSRWTEANRDGDCIWNMDYYSQPLSKQNQNVDSGRTETQKTRPDFRAKVMYVISFDGYGQVA